MEGVSNANIGVKTGDGFIVIVVANNNERNGKEIMEPYVEKFPKTKKCKNIKR